MSAGNQHEILEFLSDPKAFGGGAEKVRRVETYISVVFLVGDRVFKLKRAVRFSYLDFSTPELRRAACESEVMVNRRTAPMLYKGVVPLTREQDGGLRLGGAGEPVDWLVEMTRFDEDALLDRLARRGALNRRIMEDLADAIASFHKEAEDRPGEDGCANLMIAIDGNAQRFAECAGGGLDRAKVERLTARSRQVLEERRALLDRRRREGRFRRCHGDLHLRNIFLMNGVPTLFDAIEFNDTFVNIDVLYDFAFLLMDLDHRDMKRLANIALNRYLDVAGDGSGLAALPLFLSLRAAIRSHVSASGAAGHSDADEAERLQEEARAYLELALGYLAPAAPRLIAVGGLSGSGKSRLGREIAPFIGSGLGARIVRSDSVRKRLAGAPMMNRLGAEGYAPEMTERTYQAFNEEIAAALRCGSAVIADAVFAKPEQRRAMARIAADAGVPFHGLWLESAPEVREKRVVTRQRNISDVTIDVVHKQTAYDTGPIEWDIIDSSGPRKKTLARGKKAVGL
ncbi:MAG: hypothetical protein A3G18_05775 [Rhodospirillales bacterium RIFCSPLOWO2_12_FULL_58_28]|nr:MAG: hypothetical protein A3H92_00080 [Rhodospirillales bacterium RIFCSPLOWO2_02_FULL_58_16]OHC79293.1 MAG: hypothetical protein A3G18_05775 [Rhodospirillales bacterium RIFCSPLOWO2_12_FULL_58_28]